MKGILALVAIDNYGVFLEAEKGKNDTWNKLSLKIFSKIKCYL